VPASAVYTQGIAGRPEHVLDAHGIPLLQTNRGGQVTFHGPGQVVAYPLIDLKRLGIFVKEYVYRLEHGVLKTLEGFGVTGHRVAGAPGIYVRLDDPFGHSAIDHGSEGARRAAEGDTFAGLGKIAALGIKVSRHCTYTRRGAERGDGPEPLRRDQSVWLRRAENRRLGYTWGFH
jgi:lipoyl(octanoyl) transferase